MSLGTLTPKRFPTKLLSWIYLRYCLRPKYFIFLKIVKQTERLLLMVCLHERTGPFTEVKDTAGLCLPYSANHHQQ